MGQEKEQQQGVPICFPKALSVLPVRECKCFKTQFFCQIHKHLYCITLLVSNTIGHVEKPGKKITLNLMDFGSDSFCSRAP